MIVQLTIQNYLSFNEKVTLSLAATSIKEHRSSNVFETTIKDLNLLKGVGLFGANSSGKSNVVKAFSFMRSFVLNSFMQLHATEKINVECFKLNTASVSEPSYFELVFFVYDTKYRYGFKVTKDKVLSEWLYSATRKQERILFERDENKFEIGSNFYEGISGNVGQENIRQNSLYLSTLAQFNGTYSKMIYEWFEKLIIITDTNYSSYINHTASLISKPKFKGYFKRLLNIGNFGFNKFDISEGVIDINQFGFLSEEIRNLVISKIPKQMEIKTLHSQFDSQGTVVNEILMDFKREESQGTQKFFALAGPIIISLVEGRPLIIDEIDSRLHPNLTKDIIKLFNSIDNLNNAQLIFITHNTHILSENILRRDQMILTSKSQSQSSTMESVYSLKIRNDASFEKDYLSGRYGAIPGKGDFQLNLFKSQIPPLP